MGKRKDSEQKTNHVEKIPTSLFGKMRGDIAALEEQIKTDVTPAIIASFGFIIALVWRDAIKGALDKFLNNAGLTDQAYLYNFVSAILVTLIVIGIMIAVSKYGKSKKEKRIKNIIERKKLDTNKLLKERNEKK